MRFRLLFGILAFIFFFSLLHGFIFGEGEERLPLLNKMLSSFILVASALFFLINFFKIPSFRKYLILISVGMFFAFIGDLIMAEVIYTPDRIIFGILFFSLTHSLYILAFHSLSKFFEKQVKRYQMVIIPSLWIVGALVFIIFIYSPKMDFIMKFGTIFYTILISSMVGMAISCIFIEYKLYPISLGALLFMFSDTLLGNTLFHETTRNMGDVIFTTYILGQFVIIFSSLMIVKVKSEVSQTSKPVESKGEAI
ncbi:MAG: lysoplasmalogenase [Candidatus Methanofastidiosia archaeon]